MRFVPAVLLLAAAVQSGAPRGAAAAAADRVLALTRDTRWTLVSSVPIGFRTYHPQGMVKIGGAIFVSSVEVTVPTRRFPVPDGGHDRDAGAGIGHLFKMDLAGRLLARVRLGEGTMYHPGGLDYDGTSLWVAVAEYRPDSRSIVYRVDPGTLAATEVFRAADHLGAIVHDTDARALHGVSWGSRRFYRWALAPDGTIADPGAPLAPLRTLNPAHYVDYQDCKYAAPRRMLCTGVARLQPPGAPAVRLGGIEVVDLHSSRPLHQAPLLLWTPGGRAMTENAAWLESTPAGLRGYFMPDDDTSTLYVYEAGIEQGG